MAAPKSLPSSRPPLARMMRIHEKLQDGRLTNCTKLANELEVSTKTAMRDLAFMRDQLGLPAEYDARTFSWRYAYPVTSFPPVQVSERELLALLVAQKALEPALVTGPDDIFSQNALTANPPLPGAITCSP